ncbi:LuxR C-terminal-related transcriptional regulator [Paenibacillus radicis (ex Xue et al. 2023)]|uniref:LuxR C-terminal-related transcriptional regulator n=1 Tax=Paenibacillus radicis (ex Xue et al. 2023) TaxID=2972489 RepID=A0ABT1YTP1_9BACL|nr:LuxR C-terminal-related transcriptional regulator [Paenibacillus radicis (ex Xue et al. 2023)]MCR8635668.1 LuxR C-terminal-related transcriptional regulator [Paenibacillus radicis (ex Xue et al. 2023)]
MIVTTKLHIPTIRNTLVSRPRLISKLNEGMQAKLTLVSAQAGYGKTTVLSEWVKQCNALVAWVSLDKQDNDWIQFWSYITASIQERVPGFGTTLEPLLGNGPSLSSESLEPAITGLLNELSQLSYELVIILDDYHLIELPAIHHSLFYLIEHLPPRIHFYIASRIELTIPTARLLAKGEFHRIIMKDLRFQLDEGLLFFRETTDLLLSKDQVAELFHQTEGWISGLQLVAISLKRSENIAESIKQFSGQQQHISDYLLEEVFHHQPEPMRSFLLETSILSRMNRSLCEAVTGQMNSQEQLEKLEQQNLFIIPLDDHRNWYRYHHLLTDFLQQILSRKYPDKWLQVHSDAANWLEEHGFDEEAVEHYLKGKKYADAVRLIEKNLHTLVQSKSIALIRWVSVLPENSLVEKPMIEMFYISVLLGVGKWDEVYRRVEQAKIRFQALQEKWPEMEWNRVMGNIYFFCAVTSYLKKDLESTSQYFELVEQHMSEGSFFQTMGRNRYQGYDSFDDHLALINDLHAANAFLLKWINNWENKKEYPFIGFLYASYSKLLYEWNRLDEAELYITQALGRKDMQPFARILIPVAVSASRIQQAKGNFKQASELLEQLKLQIDSPDYELFMLRIEAEQAFLSLRQGSFQSTYDWLQRCGLEPTDEVSLNRVTDHLFLARVLVECERMEEALPLLERMYGLLTKEDRLRDRIKVLILQSVALMRMGQAEAASSKLETALYLAEPEGYIRSFIDEGLIMADMLSEYLRVQNSRNKTPLVSLAYVKQLLQALNIISQEDLPVKEALTEQETRVLLLVADGLSNKEIAHSLNISGETVKSHIKNLYRKLRVNNRVQALQCAKELKILE